MTTGWVRDGEHPRPLSRSAPCSSSLLRFPLRGKNSSSTPSLAGIQSPARPKRWFFSAIFFPSCMKTILLGSWTKDYVVRIIAEKIRPDMTIRPELDLKLHRETRTPHELNRFRLEVDMIWPLGLKTTYFWILSGSKLFARLIENWPVYSMSQPKNTHYSPVAPISVNYTKHL